MTLNTYPTGLLGITFNRTKRPILSSRNLTARSGKEQRVANWPYPKWEFELEYEFLRDNVNAELQKLEGFILQQYAQLTPFLYQDPYDNAITSQALGAGNGAQTVFRLIRSVGGFFTDLVYNATITNVYLNGTLQSGAAWAASASGNYGNDSITFVTAPGAGVVVTADFNFNYVCRFLQDKYDFTQLWLNFWEQKKIDFTTVF